MRFELDLDRRSAELLELALLVLEARVDDLPPTLLELRRHAGIAKTARPLRPNPDTLELVGDTLRSEPPAYLTRAELARRIGRSDRTIRRWIRAGRLLEAPAGIPRAELERLTRGANREQRP